MYKMQSLKLCFVEWDLHIAVRPRGLSIVLGTLFVANSGLVAVVVLLTQVTEGTIHAKGVVQVSSVNHGEHRHSVVFLLPSK